MSVYLRSDLGKPGPAKGQPGQLSAAMAQSQGTNGERPERSMFWPSRATDAWRLAEPAPLLF